MLDPDEHADVRSCTYRWVESLLTANAQSSGNALLIVTAEDKAFAIA